MGKKPKFYQTSEFLIIQKGWYETLSQNGFTDAEKFFGSKLELSQSSTYPYRHQNTQVQKENKLNYYLLITQHVALEEFMSLRDRIVMTLIADGIKIKMIQAELYKQGFGCHRQTIRFIIRKYEKKWNIRHWDQKQLTSNRAIAS